MAKKEEKYGLLQAPSEDCSVETEESSEHLKGEGSKEKKSERYWEDGDDSCLHVEFHLRGRKSSRFTLPFPIMADISHPLLPPHVAAGGRSPIAPVQEITTKHNQENENWKKKNHCTPSSRRLIVSVLNIPKPSVRL